MGRRMNMRFGFDHAVCAAGILLGVLSAVPAGAATTTAASCSQADVQAAITAAASGDTVLVPAGACTWSTPVSISGKRLKLLGAGIGKTSITDSTGRGALSFECSAANFVDVGGFTFIKGIAYSGGMIQVWGVMGEVAFRIHHSRLFDNGVAGGRGIWVSSGYGLIDHLTIDVADTTSSDQMISVSGSPGSSDGGYTPWTWPLTMGSDKAVYVEDCTFTVANQNEDVIDAYSGARLVIRNNRFYDTSVGFHGTDSGGMRSPVSVELYDNTFTNDSPKSRRAVTNRGGTAVYFNNTYGGATSWSGFYLYYYRSSYYQGLPDSWGYCDGTKYDIGSAAVSSDNSRKTVPAGTGVRFLESSPDTISASGTRYFDGSGSYGYPCRDQPGRGPGQALHPVYAWNNGSVAMGGGGADAKAPAAAENWILANRDYYNYVPIGFDGTVGVGRGTVADRPATCTPLTAYFAIDVGPQGTLFQCAARNTWREYYSPYDYPHPLQFTRPAAPANVTIK